jgi:lysophospholipase L1-like esterase
MRYRSRVVPTGLASFLLLTATLLGRSNPLLAQNESLIPIDPTIAKKQANDDRFWYDGRQLPIEGKAWNDTEDFYDRLPAQAKDIVTSKVWGLSKNSAGLCVRFATDANHFSVRWTVTSSKLGMPHMPATGVSGMDLYVKYAGGWHWIGTGRPEDSVTNEWSGIDPRLTPGTHEYLMYLPLYNGTKSFEIGIPLDGHLYRPAVRANKPICVYGTSIVQGGCASRPGMAHVAILGRRLDRPMINLGFSGSAQMEPVIAVLLGELDVAAYVLDCLPNMTTELVSQRVEPFVTSLRKARPDTPIILVESVIPQGTAFLPKAEQSITAKNAALREVFQHLMADGIQNLHYVQGEPLLGADGEATVDGVHPTDLGFIRMADALEPVLRQIVANKSDH